MRRLTALSLSVLTLALQPAVSWAEPLPRPQVDFATEGTITSGKGSSPATMRHAGGKMRVDTAAEGNNATIYIDIAARTATVVTHRLGQKIAMQVDPAQAGDAANILERDAKRVGEAKVAGEPCDEFEFESAKGRAMRACITRDGISLRTRDLSRDRIVWEATRVTRGAQNPALFAVPSDAIPMAIPRLK